MGVLPFAVVLSLLLIVALAVVGVSFMVSAFAPRRRDGSSTPPTEGGEREQG